MRRHFDRLLDIQGALAHPRARPPPSPRLCRPTSSAPPPEVRRSPAPPRRPRGRTAVIRRGTRSPGGSGRPSSPPPPRGCGRWRDTTGARTPVRSAPPYPLHGRKAARHPRRSTPRRSSFPCDARSERSGARSRRGSRRAPLSPARFAPLEERAHSFLPFFAHAYLGYPFDRQVEDVARLPPIDFANEPLRGADRFRSRCEDRLDHAADRRVEVGWLDQALHQTDLVCRLLLEKKKIKSGCVSQHRRGVPHLDLCLSHCYG